MTRPAPDSAPFAEPAGAALARALRDARAGQFRRSIIGDNRHNSGTLDAFNGISRFARPLGGQDMGDDWLKHPACRAWAVTTPVGPGEDRVG